MNLYRSTNWCKHLIAPVLIVLLGFLSCSRTGQEKVQISTSMGEIEVEIYPGLAPVTANNFLTLVEAGTYTNATFYRVVRMDNQPHNLMKIEVIQGGLFEDEVIDKYTPIEHETSAETGIMHTNGVISMARNEPGTASTEFFICIGDQPSLDFGGDRNSDGQGFAAFGKVTKGMEVVKAIQALSDNDQYLVDQVTIGEISLMQ
ncbi:MAG: peptidylprolyl isomerase [Bacteroidetes bacterium]|nr:MAG: peptidylprolyl isomerase [Bacteroidota bacterium]